MNKNKIVNYSKSTKNLMIKDGLLDSWSGQLFFNGAILNLQKVNTITVSGKTNITVSAMHILHMAGITVIFNYKNRPIIATNQSGTPKLKKSRL